VKLPVDRDRDRVPSLHLTWHTYASILQTSDFLIDHVDLGSMAPALLELFVSNRFLVYGALMVESLVAVHRI